jgi:Plasmid replication region DNA-binding N-term
MTQPVTKQDVFIAADNLAMDGIMPSILNIRETLGDRGSETTINKYLKEWKQILLKRNSLGCVFCHGATIDIKRLEEELHYYKELMRQIRDEMQSMLQPNEVLQLKEFFTRLQ